MGCSIEGEVKVGGVSRSESTRRGVVVERGGGMGRGMMDDRNLLLHPRSRYDVGSAEARDIMHPNWGTTNCAVGRQRR